MKDLKGTKTEECLRLAYAGESQACVKYSYYAKKAREDGYEQIGAIFKETSHNERAHAKLWFEYLHGGSIPKTTDNLADAAAGEQYEWEDMYREFAEIARSEGFTEIAKRFEMVAAIERTHMDRYRTLLKNIDDGIVFSREGDRIWLCRECGHIHIGKSAPKVCPVCRKPQSFFEINPENY